MNVWRPGAPLKAGCSVPLNVRSTKGPPPSARGLTLGLKRRNPQTLKHTHARKGLLPPGRKDRVPEAPLSAHVFIMGNAP
jgi:hypothetical protein